MIKDTELRKGNLILLSVNYKDNIHKVDEIYTDEIKVTSIEDGGCFPRMIMSSCNPIPITPEWLERCGFEYLPFSTDISMFSFYKKSETFELIIVNDGINCEYKHGVFYYEDEHHPVEHVHQLQNIYFALTGEELQIKMP